MCIIVSHTSVYNLGDLLAYEIACSVEAVCTVYTNNSICNDIMLHKIPIYNLYSNTIKSLTK